MFSDGSAPNSPRRATRLKALPKRVPSFITEKLLRSRGKPGGQGPRSPNAPVVQKSSRAQAMRPKDAAASRVGHVGWSAARLAGPLPSFEDGHRSGSSPEQDEPTNQQGPTLSIAKGAGSFPSLTAVGPLNPVSPNP